MPAATHRQRWTLAITSVAAFMTSLDTMIITTALPTIRAHLGGSVGQLEWTMNAYYLAFACLLITAAGLGDRIGRRRALCLGLGLFGVASLGAALAPGLAALILARAAQGAGAAVIMPLSLTVLSEAYPPEARGRAIGIWSSLLGAGGIAGPILGGGLVDLVGWRGIFWVNVPIALLVVGVAGSLITETYGPRNRLDVRGLLLASAGSLGLSWALVRSATDGWGHDAWLSVWLPLLVGAALVAGFILAEQRADHPMMPLGLFRDRTFSVANAVTVCMYASCAGGVFLMSQFFQIAQHAGPLEAALRFVPWPLPALVVAPLAGTYAARYGNRPFLVGGMLLQATGLVWFALVVDPATPYIALCPPLVINGIGLAMVFPTAAGAAVSAVSPKLMGIASGVNGTLRELGGVLGVAVVASVFARTGGYQSPTDFTDGFTAAIWACATLTGLGAVVALLTARQAGASTHTVAASRDETTAAFDA